MAIILPTGQWYTPSAVFKDAWYCMVWHGMAWFCMVLHGFAWFCMVLHDYFTQIQIIKLPLYKTLLPALTAVTNVASFDSCNKLPTAFTAVTSY